MQPADTVNGCPLGYACIYPQNADPNHASPSLMFYTYGVHLIYNQYGRHYAYNNQTDGAVMWFCTDSNGNNCPGYLIAGTGGWADLTPINSIKLTRSK
jgi:hypothetical protein